MDWKVGMDLREYIERRELTFLRAMYGSNVVLPSWKRLMAGLPEEKEARTRYFKNVCIGVWQQIKFDDVSIYAEEDLESIERILNFMSHRASLFRDCVADTADKDDDTCLCDDEDIFALERVARKGWTRVIPAFGTGIGSGVETVDVHSVKTAILAGLMGDASFERLFLMGLVHDHAEQWIGDLTPSEVVDRAAKKKRELAVYRNKVESSGLSEKKKALILHAFEMCMDDGSVEFCLIHIADKLDMAMQAWDYERKFGVDLTEFFDSAGQDIECAVDKMMTLKKNCDT